MTSNEIRGKFITFFKEKNHAVIPSASLIPENDPSALFIAAGMQPLVPFLLGEKHPQGKRLVNVQKCLRTDDIEEVGDAQHLTFFEMLGYWSLGDYFKKESIHYTFEFFTTVLSFNKDDISVTIFAGDDNSPFDQESYDTWKDEIGIPEERIYRYGKKENWWGPVGDSGPCGPCTEMFIDTGIEACSKDCGPSCKCDKFIEIGNNVFMEYNRTAGGKFEKLVQKNVDVGLGLERLAMLSQNKKTVFEIDEFEPIIKKIEEISGKKYSENKKEFRIIADHIKAAVFAISDGVVPSNKEAGYIVRRLIRRSIIKASELNVKENFTAKLAEVIFSIYDKVYDLNKEMIVSELDKEENKFRKTLTNGLKKLKVLVTERKINGKDLFNLYQTYGVPSEIVFEELKKTGPKHYKLELQDEIKIKDDFNIEMQKHQELSRTSSVGMFKGGLADSSEETIKLHTAAHLLLAALQQVLGGEVIQKGSNITAERLRFDFSHSQKLTDEEIKKVEELVNQKIQEALPVTVEEMSLDEAKKSGAHGTFSDRYGDRVKVYNIGVDPSTRPARSGSREFFSREICGGPHVKNTSELGHFKIIKEEASSAGVRRIKATLE